MLNPLPEMSEAVRVNIPYKKEENMNAFLGAWRIMGRLPAAEACIWFFLPYIACFY